MRRLALLLLLAACGDQRPVPLVTVPNATLPPPEVKVTPPPGPFNGSIVLTFETDRPATVFVSLDGSDPQVSAQTRLSGPSPFTVMLDATTIVKYFVSDDAKDGPLQEGTWVRAGGPVGTISGVVVVGDFAVGKEVAVTRNVQTKRLGKPMAAGEVPFLFEMQQSGTYRLTGYSDRNDDGQIIPLIDFASDPVTVQLDLTDPFKASAENVRLYLGASATGLGTLRGIINLPKPPILQNLQISLISPSSFTAGFDPTTLLQQLQGGYRIFTDPAVSDYPYVITNLEPGQYVGVPSLFGFGSTGIALNFIANPLRPIRIEADQETVQNYAFGPVNLSGTVTIAAASAPSSPIGFGIVAARVTSLTDGIQAVLMPIILTRDSTTGDVTGSYQGTALRSNQTVNLRVFSNGQSAILDALTWVINPFATQPAHATAMVSTIDMVKDITVP
ncbi:MAG: hypothetical protein JNG84_13285 [Archangium sp.]|nr:hypothetical protein [Archangium sp.]